MSDAFKGLTFVQDVVADLSEQSGIPMTVSTVSCEPTHYKAGQYPVNRSVWEEALIRLFEAYSPDRENSWREYGEDFENDTFYVRYDRQDWECTCGFDKEAQAFHESHPHTRDCWYERVARMLEDKDAKWRPLWEAALAQRDAKPPTFEETIESREACRIYDEWHAEEDAWIKAQGWPAGKSGSHVYCDCGQDAVIKAWFAEHGCVKPCGGYWARQPNFLHKPSGYGVYWYKYPCRDSYGTQSMTVRRFNEIIDECIASLK